MITKEELVLLKEKYSQNGLSLERERAKTRNAYKSPESMEQLIRLLHNCYLFRKIETEEQLAKRNLAISILDDMGFGDMSNIELNIRNFFNDPIIGELKKNEE